MTRFTGSRRPEAASDRTVHPLWTDGRNNTNDAFTSRVQLDLFSDADTISAATGGVVNFTLNPGPNYQGADYFVFGSYSGTSPGLTFPSGVNLPLNYDMFFVWTLQNGNSAALQNFRGTLDAQGMAYPILDTGGPFSGSVAGLHLDFAALVLLNGEIRWASNPTGLTIEP